VLIPTSSRTRRHDLGSTAPDEEGDTDVKLALQVLLATVVATAALAGCGGSDGPETVNGCVIEPSTSCASVDLSGADLSGADLSRATLSGANLEDTDLSDSNLTEANLSSAQIVGTDLSGADLTSANLTGATITGANLDGATLCRTTRTDGTVDDTSCPATTTGTETTETSTTAVSDAELTSLDVGDLDCGAAATGPVTVSWETSNTTAVEIAVDGLSPAGFGPSGSTTVVVPCDGESHQITVTPQSDAGPGQAESEEVSSG
jgi:Pentapeptide repeats (8 copies)